MPPTELHIHVLSPMLIAGASATGDPADTDVHTDVHGFPEIPAGRVTARLRDAAIGVAAAAPELTPTLLQLLGATGSAGSSRAVTAGAARLPGDVRAAVAQTLPEHCTLDRRRIISAVTDAYTGREFNTRIDRHCAPADGSLQETRVVQPGVTFIAPLTWNQADAGDTAALTTALARTVLGVRQLGGRESDGRGHVSIDFGRGRAAAVELAGLSTVGVTG